MIGVNDLKANNCTHCMIMDVDEFYIQDEFEAAKDFIYKNKITHSCCSIYDYRISPHYRRRDISQYCVPFIFKLRKNSQITINNNMPCLVDPCRSFKYKKYNFISKDIFYYLNNICMHHMTGVRLNIDKKFELSMANINNHGKKIINNLIQHHHKLNNMQEEDILKNGYILVDNIFNINI